MDVTYGNSTYTGLVMARNVPNGTWVNGTTYNTSNIDGPVFITTIEGEKIDIPEGETFTIEAMRSQDGSSISNVSTTRYNYKTSNASELEQREPTTGGGGWSGGGSIPEPVLFGGIGIVAALLAVVAINKD